jgi:hypothetical protein
VAGYTDALALSLGRSDARTRIRGYGYASLIRHRIYDVRIFVTRRRHSRLSRVQFERTYNIALKSDYENFAFSLLFDDIVSRIAAQVRFPIVSRRSETLCYERLHGRSVTVSRQRYEKSFQINKNSSSKTTSLNETSSYMTFDTSTRCSNVFPIVC